MFALKQAAKPQKACVAPTKEQQRRKNEITFHWITDKMKCHFFLFPSSGPLPFVLILEKMTHLRPGDGGASKPSCEREALQVSHIHQLSFSTKSTVISYNKLCSVSINSFVQLRLEIFSIIKPTPAWLLRQQNAHPSFTSSWTSSDAWKINADE